MKQKTKATLSLSIISVILTFLTSYASANVMGFDFGSTFFKITLVRPGQPFQIVENTTSNRKTDSQFTIAKENRLFGADSFIATSRFPKTTFADVASNFAVPFSQETIDNFKLNKFILNDFVEDERGFIAFQTFSIDKKELKEDEDAKTTYFTEELVAMILAYGRDLAEKQAGGQLVKEAVITVPSYYNGEKRRMLLDAAELSGINVVSLVHENVAAALMYGIDRMDTEKDLNVLIYNMGGRDTEVSIVRYSAVTDAKNKTFEQVEVLGEGYDETLGGKEFDHVIARILADKFNSLKERQGKPDIRTNNRAMKRIYKEAISIKAILSANRVVNVKIPELADYVTLAFELSRETFEQECAELLSRVKNPVQQALDQAGLTVDEIEQVEILGGGIRVPKVQQILKEAMNDKELNVHLNGDEAMSFGASYIAANSTQSLKVRKVFLTQHPQHDIRINIHPLDEKVKEEKRELAKNTDGEEEVEDKITYEKETVLYKRSDYLGQKKTIHLYYDVSMRIEATAIYEDGSEQQLATWDIDLAKLIEERDVLRKERVTRPKLSLAFEMSRSHLVQLLSARVNVEETIMEEVVKPVPVKDEKKESADGEEAAKTDSEDAASEKTAEKADEMQDAETDDSDKSSPDEKEAEAVEEEKEYKEKVVPHAFTIDDLGEQLPGLRLLSKETKKASKKKISALAQRDKDKILADEAKNGYESKIYELRDWLRDEENEKYVSEGERDALLQKLEEGEDWLYDEGSQMPHTKYQERSYELTKEHTKFQKRKEEHNDREIKIPQLRRALEESRTRAHEIREAMPWVTEQEQQDLVSKVEETSDWLEKKMQEQEKLSLLDEPAFTIDEVNKEMAKMTKLAKKIFGKKKPKEPKKPKADEEEVKKNDANQDQESSQEKVESEEAGKTEEAKQDEQEQQKVEDL